MKRLNLVGQTFGRLKVIEETRQRDGSNIVYKCLCECGNECFVSTRHLRSGNVKSCGCQRREKSKANLAGDPKEKMGIVFGTNVSRISSNKLQKNNTSGYPGVYWFKSKQVWVAYIYFQKKRYFLGSRKNKEEAIALRMKAEEHLFKNFLEWYYKQFPDKIPKNKK